MTMRKVGYIALLALSGCTPSADMQGVNPTDYYAAHPIKNQVESRDQTFMTHFEPQALKLTPDAMDRLHHDMHGISMAAVQSIRIGLTAGDMHNEARKKYIAKLLRHMGYDKGHVMYAPMTDLHAGDVQLDVTYAVVVPPDCPDWRMSPVTSYSNTYQGNFKCSQEVNIGQMVADPTDLVHGTGDLPPDTAERASKALQDYREGKTPSSAAPAASAGGAGSSGSSGASGASGASGGAGAAPQ